MSRATVPTGSYAEHILDVYSRKDTKLPPISHFQAFFSQFGPILTIYHQDNSRSLKKPDHVFIVFKNEGTIKSAKMHLVQRNTSDAWIKSCNIVSGTKYCLPALMNQIKSIAGEAPISSINSSQSALSGKPIQRSMQKESDLTPRPQSLKVDRIGESDGAQPMLGLNSGRKRTAPNQSGSSFNKVPTPLNAPPHQSISKRKTMAPDGLPTEAGGCPSLTAVNPVQEAAELAAGARSRNSKSSTGGEAEKLRLELERMKARYNKLQSEREQLQVKHDEEMKQLKAEAEKYRELKTKVERLKWSLKGRHEKSHQVVNRMLVSLQKMTGGTPG